MSKNKADYTNTFRALTLDEGDKTDLFKEEEFRQWHQAGARLNRQSEAKFYLRS